jgi:DNA invertase Pin-like site-specific DNA recombinase
VAIIGYRRVSTRDQHPESQRDALTGAGCDPIFIDKASGKLDRRPELDKALLVVREGDTLVIARLDRLARSPSNCTTSSWFENEPGVVARHRAGHRGGGRMTRYWSAPSRP